MTRVRCEGSDVHVAWIPAAERSISRGRCPVCNRMIALRKGRFLRVHGRRIDQPGP